MPSCESVDMPIRLVVLEPSLNFLSLSREGSLPVMVVRGFLMMFWWGEKPNNGQMRYSTAEPNRVNRNLLVSFSSALGSLELWRGVNIITNQNNRPQVQIIASGNCPNFHSVFTTTM